MANWDFWDWCFAALLVFAATFGGVVVAMYAAPGEPLVVPELETAARIASLDDFPANSARLERWGEELILVVRESGGEVTAVSAVSPQDGCVVRWDPQVQQIVSPCTYLVYNRRGGVVTGLSDEPLRSWPVLIRDGVVYVGRAR